jgi:phage-related tail fiber protein
MSLILTQAGLAAYAQADATGVKLQATHMAAGDGGGQAVAHTSDSTALVRETWRGELQEITVAASGEVEFVAHVPISVGGWCIREVAIYADDVLLAVGAHPQLWKPAPESPDKVELVITAPVKFANAATLSLTVDTTKVLASQKHVVEKIDEHDQDEQAHAFLQGLIAGLEGQMPGPATTTLAGVIELATNTEAITGTDALRAVTPAALAARIAALLASANAWDKVQTYGAPAALAINAGTVTWDAGAAPKAKLTLTENVTAITLQNAANEHYELTIVQDATGGRTVAWPAGWLWPGGSAAEVTADAWGVDVYTLSGDAGTIRVVGAQDFKAVS